MTRRSHTTADDEPGRAVARTPWRPDEEHRHTILARYLSAIAAYVSAKRDGAARGRATEPTAPLPHPGEFVPAGADVRVRDVMDVPAFSIRNSASFREVVHTLARGNLGAVPVVDADDRVQGVVSVSDLLADAATEPMSRPAGGGHDRGPGDRSADRTAGTLMTAPAVTIRPETTVTEATWLAARSRLKHLPVTDRDGHLLGVIRRASLLQALVHDDDRIREEIESRVISEFAPVSHTVDVTVCNGIVDVHGEMAADGIPGFLRAISEVDDVTEVVNHLAAL